MKRATKSKSGAIATRIISIHALVKRATQAVQTCVTFHVISIHALVKRATFAGTNFFARDLGISIHALVKRATLKPKDSPKGRRFQSTPS